MAATGAQLVVLGSTDVPTVQTFMQVFQQQHYTPKLFIAASGPDQGGAFISAVGQGNENGMMVPDGWYPGYANAASQQMVREYLAQYGGTASGVNADVAEAYSVGQIMAQAVTATAQHRQRQDHRLPAQRRHAEQRPGSGEVRRAGRERGRGGVRLPVAEGLLHPGPAEHRLARSVIDQAALDQRADDVLDLPAGLTLIGERVAADRGWAVVRFRYRRMIICRIFRRLSHYSYGIPHWCGWGISRLSRHRTDA